MIIFPDDQIWTSLQVGNLDEKNTEKIQGGTTFEESISLLIYDLANDKVFDKLQTVHSRLQTGFWNVELQNVIFFPLPGRKMSRVLVFVRSSEVKFD